MPAEVSDWGAVQYLSILHGLAAPPDGYWVALATDEPGAGTDGTLLAGLEPQDSAYARQFIGMGPDNWSDADLGGYIANLVPLDFGIPTVDWGLVPYLVLCDAQNLGNVYGYCEFNEPAWITASFDVQVPAGALTLALGSQTPSIASY